MQIEGIQYLRPDGKQRPFTTEIPDELREQWEAIVAAGCRLEAEELTTGEVSLTITTRDGNDFLIEVTENGPAVAEALRGMIEEFTAAGAAAFVKAMAE